MVRMTGVTGGKLGKEDVLHRGVMGVLTGLTRTLSWASCRAKCQQDGKSERSKRDGRQAGMVEVPCIHPRQHSPNGVVR